MSRPFRKNYIATNVPNVKKRKNFSLKNDSRRKSLTQKQLFQ